MGKLSATLSALAIGTALGGCDSEPRVEAGIELTDPILNRELTCTREKFYRVAFYNPLGGGSWAAEHCPGFEADVERLRKTEHPLAEIVEVRREVLSKAGVAGNSETWVAPASGDETEMVITVDPLSVQAARKAGKAK